MLRAELSEDQSILKITHNEDIPEQQTLLVFFQALEQQIASLPPEPTIKLTIQFDEGSKELLTHPDNKFELMRILTSYPGANQILFGAEDENTELNAKIENIIKQRNLLMEQLGVNHTNTPFWDEIIARHILYNTYGFSWRTPSIEFPVPIHSENPTMQALGDFGSELCIRHIIDVSARQNITRYQKKFSLNITSPENPLSVEAFFHNILKYQEKHNHVFPFEDVCVINYTRPPITYNFHDSYNNIINFLKQNPQVRFLDIQCRCDIDAVDSADFLMLLEDQQITATVRISSNDRTLQDKIDNLILKNRRDAFVADRLPELQQAASANNELAPMIIPASWRKPRKQPSAVNLATQFEHTAEQVVDATTMTSQDRFMQQMTERQQQLQQRSQTQNFQTPKEENALYMDLIHSKEELLANSHKFQAIYHCFRLDANEIQRFMNTLWDNVVGNFSPFIQAISYEALTKIISHRDAFQAGLSLDNLPRGFYLVNVENHIVLCFDSAKNTQTNPLKVKLEQKRNEYFTTGTIEQFIEDNDPDLDAFQQKFNRMNQKPEIHALNSMVWRDAVIKIMGKMDDGARVIERINGEFSEFLTYFNALNWFACFEIIMNTGAKGFEKFLEPLKALHEKSVDLFESFYRCFIRDCENLSDLFKPEAQEALQYLLSIDDSNVLEWWISLTNRQAEATGVSHLIPMTEAFKFFLEKLPTIGTGLHLPNPCAVTHSANMNISLDRLLHILNASVDPEQQLAMLGAISLAQDAAYYAVVREGFRLVTGDMKLESEYSLSNRELRYRLDFQEFCDLTQKQNATFDDLKHLFYRWVGMNVFSMPYHYYQTIIKQIESAELDDNIKCLLLPILARATVGEAALRMEPIPELTSFIEKLKTNEPQKHIHALIVMQRILEKLPNHSFDLKQCQAIFKFCSNSDLAKIHNFEEILRTYQSDVVLLIQKLGENPVPAIQQFINKLFGLFGTKDDIFNRYSEQTKLAILTSLANLSSDVNKNSLKDLVRKFATLDEVNLSKILAVLIQIDIPNSLGHLPTATELCQLLDDANNHDPDHLLSSLRNRHSGLMLINNETVVRSLRFDCTNIIKELLIEYGQDTSILEGMKNDAGIITLEDVMSQLKEKMPMLYGMALKKLSLKFINALKNEINQRVSNLKLEINTSTLQNYLHSVLHQKGDALEVSHQKFEMIRGFLTALHTMSKLIEEREMMVNFILAKNISPENFIQSLPQINDLLRTDGLSADKKQRILGLILESEIGIAEQQGLLIRLSTLAELNPAICHCLLNNVENFESLRIFLRFVDQNTKTIPEIYSEKLVILFKDHANDFESIVKNFNQLEFNSAVKKNKILNILNACLSLEIEYTENLSMEIIILSSKLSQYDEEDLERLHVLYQTRPYPKISHILEDDFNSLGFEMDPFGNRSPETLAKQFEFSDERVKARIAAIYEKTTLVPLTQNRVNTLFEKFKCVNGLGLWLVSRSHEDLKTAVQLLSKQLKGEQIELPLWLATYSQQFVATYNNKPKIAAELILIACFIEIYYRTSDKGVFANPSQICDILCAMEDKGNVISGIRTGQGKSLISVIEAAMLWAEGKTVAITTSDMLMAAKGYNDARDFFTFLGAKSTLISANSKAEDYCYNGINFSDMPSLALFRNQLAIHGKLTPPEDAGAECLICDEIDHNLFDERNSYILSQADPDSDPYVNEDEWMYNLINDFVDFLDDVSLPVEQKLSEDKKAQIKPCLPVKPTNAVLTIEDEVIALRRYLMNNSNNQSKRITRLSGPNFHLELDQWIVSAKQARGLVEQEGISFKTDTVTVEIQKQSREFNTTIILDETTRLPKFGSKWSNGVQQLLHARLNKALSPDESRYLIYPETKALSQSSSKNVFDYFLQQPGGRILGMTGSVGSDLEVSISNIQYAFNSYEFPPEEISKLKPLPTAVTDNQQKFHEEILADIYEFPNNPILILVDNEIEVRALQAYLNKRIQGKTIQTITPSQVIADQKHNSNTVDEALKNAGNPNVITISTFTRRGYDIRLADKEKGLVVLDAGLVGERGSVQGSGRTARQDDPGFYKRIYRTDVIEKKSGKNISSQKPKDRTHEVKSSILQLEQQDHYSRMQQERLADILSVIQKHLNSLIEKFKLDFPNYFKEKPINEFRAELLKELTQRWQFILANQQNLPANSAIRLNIFTNAFIESAQQYWQQSIPSLIRIFRTPFQEEFPEGAEIFLDGMRELANLDLGQKLIEKSTQISQHKLQHESETFFDTQEVLTKLKTDIPRVVTHSKHANTLMRDVYRIYINRLEAQQASQFQNFRKQSNIDLFRLAKQVLVNSLNSYKKSWGISGDRKNEAIKLIENIQNIDANNPECWELLLSHINEAIQNSIVVDMQKQKNWYSRTRGAQSNFRTILFDLKAWAFSTCPATADQPGEQSIFEKLLSNEILQLRHFLTEDLKRDSYKKSYNLQIKIRVLLRSIPLDLENKNLGDELLKIRIGLDTIYNHPDFEESKSSLSLLDNNFELLLAEYAYTQPQEFQQKVEIYRTLRANSEAIEMPKHSFLSKPKYTIAEELGRKFSDALSHIPIENRKARYAMCHQLEKIDKLLQENLHAYDISYALEERDDVNMLTVSYSVMDELSYKVTKYSQKIDLRDGTTVPVFEAPDFQVAAADDRNVPQV